MLKTRRWFGCFLSKIIMPAQWQFPKDPNFLPGEKKLIGGVLSKRHIDSTREAKVALFEIHPQHTTRSSRVILHGFGNADCVENHIDELSATHQNLFPEAIVSGMNFRNVNSSGPAKVFSEEDWVDDVIAVVNYYREQGIRLKNILLSGHSLSGAIFTMAAAQIYQTELQKRRQSATPALTETDHRQCSPSLFNNRSFSTLAEVLIAMVASKWSIASNTGVGIGVLLLGCGLAMWVMSATTALLTGGLLIAFNILFPEFRGVLLRPLLNTLLWLGFGQMDALTAYRMLPDGAKDYIMAKDDGVILQPASLHQGFKRERRAQKQSLKEAIARTREPSLLATLKARLEEFSEVKVRYGAEVASTLEVKPSLEAHCEPLSQLHRYCKMKLQNATFFRNSSISGEDLLVKKSKKMLGLS